MTSDTDFDTDTDSAPEMPGPLEVAERDAATDARLDATVRDAARTAFDRERPDHDAVMARRQNGETSMDDTIRASWDNIQARPPEPVMPSLPGNPTMEATMTAQAEWDRSPKSIQHLISGAHKELGAMKEAAEGYGIRLETMADVKAFREMMGQQANGQSAESSAPNPVWEKIGIGSEIGSNDEGLARLDHFASRHGETFARNGVSMAQGLEYLMAAQELLERDPQRGIDLLAQAYGVAPGAAPTNGDQARYQHAIEDFAADKGAEFEDLRQAMATVAMEEGFAVEGVPLRRQLETAFREAKRRMAQHAKRDPSKRLEDRVDETARGIYERHRK